MKRTLLAFLLLLSLAMSGDARRWVPSIVVASGGTLAHVQAQGTKWFGGNGTTESTAAITVTGGNLLVVSVAWVTNTNTVASIAGNSNTFTPIDTANTAAGALSTYYVKNANAGSTAITVTWTGDPGYGYITVHEVSGASLTAPLDQHQIGTPTLPSSGVVSSGTVTPGTNGQYVFGSTFDSGGGATITAGTGFTVPTNANQSSMGASEYQIQATAGAIDATFAETGANFSIFFTGIATFK